MLDAVESSYPIVNGQDLTPALFKEMMSRHRCLLARNLFSMTDVINLRAVADMTYQIYDKGFIDTGAGGPLPDSHYVTDEVFTTSRDDLQRFRQFGSLILSSCPIATGTILPILSKSIVRDCVKAYFGSEIGLSLNSSSVRFSEPSATVRRVFHQDGNFLGGADAETINCWIALDPCGVHAPTMEVFAERVDDLLPAGTEGAVTSWEIAEDVVYGRLGRENAWFPEFRPGDAFLFDHLHVHRTHISEGMTRSRYAMESWMFPVKQRYRRELLAWIG